MSTRIVSAAVSSAVVCFLVLLAAGAAPAVVSQVADIYPGSSGSFPGYLTVFNSELYFGANDGTTGAELWAIPEPGTLLLLAPGLASLVLKRR